MISQPRSPQSLYLRSRCITNQRAIYRDKGGTKRCKEKLSWRQNTSKVLFCELAEQSCFLTSETFFQMSFWIRYKCWKQWANEGSGRLGCKVVQFGESPTFRRKISPSSRSEIKSRKKSCFRLLPLVFCLAYSSTLKMAALCSSETSVSLRSTRC
jgi:hypothetical protein